MKARSKFFLLLLTTSTQLFNSHSKLSPELLSFFIEVRASEMSVK